MQKSIKFYTDKIEKNDNIFKLIKDKINKKFMID